MGTAKFIKDVSCKFKGDMRLYEVEPPMKYDHWHGDSETTERCSKVVVSAVHTWSGPETYIFAADDEGNVLDWSELHGSF